MAALPKVTDELLLSVAKEHLEAADGNVRVATETLMYQIKRDKKLLAQLTDPLLATACYTVITSLCRQERRKIWTMPTYTVNEQGKRVAALAEGNIMSWPLPGGKRLGEATREDIWFASDFYEKQGKDMLHKSRWLTLVGQSLPDNTIVKDVLSEERLLELKNLAH